MQVASLEAAVQRDFDLIDVRTEEEFAGEADPGPAHPDGGAARRSRTARPGCANTC